MTKYQKLRECSTCHQTKPHHGRGMCQACYCRWRRAHGDDESPGVWVAGWVRDGMVLRPAVNIREWTDL